MGTWREQGILCRRGSNPLRYKSRWGISVPCGIKSPCGINTVGAFMPQETFIPQGILCRRGSNPLRHKSPYSLQVLTPSKPLLPPTPCSLKWSTTSTPTFTNRHQGRLRRFRTIGVNHASGSAPLLVHTTAIGHASW